MEEIEVSPEAEAILLGLSESDNPDGARKVREFYKAKAQNGNKLVGQVNGYQIKYDQKKDQFYHVT